MTIWLLYSYSSFVLILGFFLDFYFFVIIVGLRLFLYFHFLRKGNKAKISDT